MVTYDFWKCVLPENIELGMNNSGKSENVVEWLAVMCSIQELLGSNLGRGICSWYLRTCQSAQQQHTEEELHHPGNSENLKSKTEKSLSWMRSFLVSLLLQANYCAEPVQFLLQVVRYSAHREVFQIQFSDLNGNFILYQRISGFFPWC